MGSAIGDIVSLQSHPKLFRPPCHGRNGDLSRLRRDLLPNPTLDSLGLLPNSRGNDWLMRWMAGLRRIEFVGMTSDVSRWNRAGVCGMVAWRMERDTTRDLGDASSMYDDSSSVGRGRFSRCMYENAEKQYRR